MLFGCPIYRVGQLVPAGEMPLWRAYYAQEPWGFRASDMLQSKTAMQIAQASGRLKPGVGFADFMFKDRFESMELSDDEYQALSKEEKNLYLDRKIAALRKVLN